jgi:hypothetical protein
MGMNMSFKKEHRQETIIYLVLWALLFMAPVMSLSVRSANTGIDFDWSEIFTVWKQYALYFLVFLIHNHLMAPMLVYRQQRWRYLALSAAIIVIFQVYQCNHRPDFRQRKARRAMIEQIDHQRPPMPPDHREGDFEPRPDDHEGFEPRPDGPRRDGLRHERRQHPPLIFGQHDLVSIIILVLMLGMNLGVKLYFKQRSDQKHLAQLERQNLEQQLEYLKYQINPHFFMNTLNNIHALVDIDPEKAKSTILELSKMMRFMLYEGSKSVVPLEREMTFLQNYITLMKLRYTDKVRISVDVPASLPNKDVPPLMFITFVENAFKHGVSYRQESFIDIAMAIANDRLTFTCVNSRIPKEEDKHGGVGLANVRQRLDLIYGQNYQLDIRDEQTSYTVKLTLPL